MEKHILKHNEENSYDEQPKRLKEEEEEEENINHIKLEPETNVAEEKATPADENDFLDRLLDDLEYPIEEKRRKKKKRKPATKDFSCNDCGKAFYFQKNLFTHVVEKHGKSVDELPNLSLVKSEDGIIK